MKCERREGVTCASKPAVQVRSVSHTLSCCILCFVFPSLVSSTAKTRYPFTWRLRALAKLIQNAGKLKQQAQRFCRLLVPGDDDAPKAPLVEEPLEEIIALEQKQNQKLVAQ